jgi:hypothetical protein
MITYFHLRGPDSERLLADNKSYPNREYLRCPLTAEHLDGDRRIGPLSVEVNHNSRDELVIWCWVEGCVVHKRLLDEYEAQGFTGYRTKPATVRFRDGLVSTDYREFIVTGWAGMALPESGIQVKKDCPACHWKNYTPITNYEKLIDWTKWTGDDFFMVWPLPLFTLVTDRVAQFLLKRKAKSFCLRGLEDRFPTVRKFGFTVARLSDFLPEDLAIKYGRPLGLE